MCVRVCVSVSVCVRVRVRVCVRVCVIFLKEAVIRQYIFYAACYCI